MKDTFTIEVRYEDKDGNEMRVQRFVPAVKVRHSTDQVYVMSEEFKTAWTALARACHNVIGDP